MYMCIFIPDGSHVSSIFQSRNVVTRWVPGSIICRRFVTQRKMFRFGSENVLQVPTNQAECGWAVAETKTGMCEEFGEAMEKGFWTASKRFWQIVRRLRRGKQCCAFTVYSTGGALVTSTEDIVRQWKEETSRTSFRERLEQSRHASTLKGASLGGLGIWCSPQTSWRRLGRGRSGLLCLGCCPRNPAWISGRKWMNG